MWKLLLLSGFLIVSKANAQDIVKRQSQQTLNVGVIVEPNFISESKDGYEGFIVDLLNKFGDVLNISWNYVVLVSSQEELIQKIQEKSVDVGAGPVVINDQDPVTFSRPIINVGLQMLTTRPEPPMAAYNYRLFVYLRPFTSAAWFFCLLCTLAVGIILYLLNRYHPKENDGVVEKATCSGEGWRLADSFWWICRSFTLQGVQSRPKSITARIVAVAWIMFILDSLFLYLSALIHNVPLYYGPHNLVAEPLPFKSAKELFEQNEYQYGTLEKYRSVFVNSTTFPDASESLEYFSDVESGLARARSDDKFVFIIDSLNADYSTSHDCSLITVGDVFNITGYGLAFPEGSSVDKYNDNLLSMFEDGSIHMLVMKWFKPDPQCPEYDENPTIDPDYEKPEEIRIGMDGYGGPVCLLIICLLIALVVVIIELKLTKKIKIPRKKKKVPTATLR